MSLWNRSAEKKDDNTGKSPQDELLEKFSTLVSEALKPVIEKVDAQGTEVKTLATKFSALETEAGKELEAEAERRRLAADAELTPEQKAEKDRQNLFAQTVLTNARITENECVAELEAAFPKLIPEFRQMCANTDWKIKALPNYKQQCLNAIDSLIGREARKNGLRYQKNTEKFVIEDAGARGSGEGDALISGDYDWTDERSGKTLTATQQLAKLGLTAKDFAEMQKMGIA